MGIFSFNNITKFNQVDKKQRCTGKEFEVSQYQLDEIFKKNNLQNVSSDEPEPGSSSTNHHNEISRRQNEQSCSKENLDASQLIPKFNRALKKHSSSSVVDIIYPDIVEPIEPDDDDEHEAVGELRIVTIGTSVTGLPPVRKCWFDDLVPKISSRKHNLSWSRINQSIKKQKSKQICSKDKLKSSQVTVDLKSILKASSSSTVFSEIVLPIQCDTDKKPNFHEISTSIASFPKPAVTKRNWVDAVTPFLICPWPCCRSDDERETFHLNLRRADLYQTINLNTSSVKLPLNLDASLLSVLDLKKKVKPRKAPMRYADSLKMFLRNTLTSTMTYSFGLSKPEQNMGPTTNG